MPLVSVIIPAYNRENTISRAVQSVLNQTFQDFEIIIVNDASWDNTTNMIGSFKDPRIHLINHDFNKGASASRNTGVKNATGNYVAFLDSDDEWVPSKLEVQLKAMQNDHGSSPRMRLSCTGFNIHLLDDNKTIEKKLDNHKHPNYSIAVGCEFSPGSTLMVAREVFNEVGFFDENLPRLEDWDWLLRYSVSGTIGIIPEILSIIYNKRGRQGEAFLRSIPLFIQKNNKLLGVKSDIQNYPKKNVVIGQIWLHAVGSLLREKKYVLGVINLFKAHLYDPLIIVRYYFNKVGAGKSN